MKKILVALLALVLTGGIGYAQEIDGYVDPGAQFTMQWTPADPAGDAYYVERSLNGGEFVPMISVVDPQVVDTLQAEGDAAQYRVYAYREATWTDSTGTHSQKYPGPTSEVSNTVIAGTAPVNPGGCGKPSLVKIQASIE